MRLLLLYAMLSAPLWANPARVIRTCRVYDKPSKEAKLSCTLKSGDKITVISQDGKISEVVSENCKGFLYSSCFSMEDEKEKNATAEKELATKSFQVGFVLEGEGPLAKTSSSSLLSKGLGFGIGALAQYRLIRGLYLMGQPAYRYQKLSRTIDGSGALRDPSAGSYSQAVWNVAIQVGAVANILELINKRSNVVPWTVKVGGEFLFPTSAMQTDASGTETSFEATKMVNAILGTAIDFSLSDSMSFRLGGDLFYHVTARDSTSLYGIRFAGACIFGL